MALPRRPRAVVFDLDGLLFDTETLYRAALFAAADAHGHAMTDAVFGRLLGCPWTTNRATLLDHYGPAFPVDEIREAWIGHFDRLSTTDLALKPGAAELLDALDDLNLPRAIATSSFRETASRHLAHHDIANRFHHLVAHGDYAESKPAPDPFLRAAERLGMPPSSCLALEDSHNGVRSAAAAGMMTVMVPDLLPPTDELRALCAHVATDLHEVRRLILDAAP